MARQTTISASAGVAGVGAASRPFTSAGTAGSAFASASRYTASASAAPPSASGGSMGGGGFRSPTAPPAAPPGGAGGTGGRNAGGGRPPSPPDLPSESGAGDTDPRRPKPEVSTAGSATERMNHVSTSYLGRPPSPIPFATAKVTAEVVPGLGRPFRAENPINPADQKTVDFMNVLPIDDKRYDCSEITDSIHLFNRGEGSKLKITPNIKFGTVSVPERRNGIIQSRGYDYHFIYYNKGYIYDPRLSSAAIPSGDYFKLVKQYNPGGFILEEEVFRFATGITYRGMKP